MGREREAREVRARGDSMRKAEGKENFKESVIKVSNAAFVSERCHFLNPMRPGYCDCDLRTVI
jgi:hypothetical protein